MQTLDLPQPVQTALTTLFEAMPIEQAMEELVVYSPLSKDLSCLVNKLITDPAIADRPALKAALWLYVDELDESHRISQNIHTADGSYWHGIMHRREGDFSNSHYWLHKVGHRHPVYTQIQGYDPHQLIDDVQANPRDPRLAQRQRGEWIALVNHCARA